MTVRAKAPNIRPFLAAAARADAETKERLKAEHAVIAKEWAEAVQAKARSLGSTAAKSADSISALATPTASKIVLAKNFGGEHGAEFGSIAFKQFRAWRGNSADAGYFMHPTVREKQPEAAERLGNARASVIEKALDKLDP